MMNNFLTPSEIAEFTVNAGIKKANLTVMNQFILGILAGAFIAFGAQAANMASHTITNVSIGKLIGGLIFPVGLMLVLMAGAELFTGNCLMIMALAERKINLIQLLRSWIIVYLGNLAGGILIAFLISWSGQLNYTGGLLGGFTIKAAAGKINLSFMNAFVLGILCNWIVCLAVWISFGAKDGISKAVLTFFPIWLFVASGFEHSIANMYYIPAGIIAKCNPSYVAKALESGASQSAVDSLNWCSMFTDNLLPVTLGNIIGGSCFAGMIYWFAYLRSRKS
ncbi:MAG: formate/nitrite transporter family protein [Synergistaceae bacterium]|nr:formate/nitrite transporter family protein [Synergistaceae bacterium]